MVKYCSQSLLVLAVLGTATLAFTGCGQKGPLYLPADTIAEQERLQAIEQEAEEEVLGPQRQGGDTGSLIPSGSSKRLSNPTQQSPSP